MIFNRRLTDEEMEELHQVASNPTDTIIKFYDLALAPATFEEQEEIQPTEFKLPEDQWAQVCSWLREAQPDPNNAFTACWAWMNSGPSAQQEVA